MKDEKKHYGAVDKCDYLCCVKNLEPYAGRQAGVRRNIG